MDSENINKYDLDNIKSNYFLLYLFNILPKNKQLEIIKYTKKIRNRLNITLNDYKEYSEKFTPIEIDIIPIKTDYNVFIHPLNDEIKQYYHIYFNESKKEEIERNEFNEDENVSKIKVVIDYQVKSFENLFRDCKCIKSIYFKKFYRNVISNMSYMFFGCSSLKELNLSNFNTNNVTDMNNMFLQCQSLKEINLSNFNTEKVKDMSCMFFGCSSLKELNFSNFNTNNVTNMCGMFIRCSSLIEFNVSTFNTRNVTDMVLMFSECSSLTELNIKNFNTKNVTIMKGMFLRCSEELIMKIRFSYENIREEAFKLE